MFVLEASYLIHRLPAWRPNIRTQVVKARKLHFFDTGLACYRIGIQAPERLRLHPLREFPIGWSLKEINDETTSLPSRWHNVAYGIHLGCGRNPKNPDFRLMDRWIARYPDACENFGKDRAIGGRKPRRRSAYRRRRFRVAYRLWPRLPGVL
jgi:hypothetical protein